MLDFSKISKPDNKESHAKFGDLLMGETFALAEDIVNGTIDTEKSYIYIKTDSGYALELNEDNLDAIGNALRESTPVVRVKIAVKSISLIV